MQAQHMIWEATAPNGQTAYLMGTVHIVKPDLYPLDTLYDEVFEKSDALVLEVRTDSLQADFQKLMPKYGLYVAGESIKDHLSEETYKKLAAKLDSLGTPLAMMQQMKPWVIATSMEGLEMQKAGYSAQGIDAYFFDKAQKADKEIVSLETTEEQMKIFAGMSDKEQTEYLEYKLSNAQESVEAVDTMMAYWENGKSEKLADFLIDEMENQSKEAYDNLLINRNKKWVPKIIKLVETGKTPLIAVGSAHLVGEKSVNDLLKKKGFKIKQL